MGQDEARWVFWDTPAALNYFISSADSPFGVIPLLEFDGKVISSSTAIARWLAEDHGEDYIVQLQLA